MEISGEENFFLCAEPWWTSINVGFETLDGNPDFGSWMTAYIRNTHDIVTLARVYEIVRLMDLDFSSFLAFHHEHTGHPPTLRFFQVMATRRLTGV